MYRTLLSTVALAVSSMTASADTITVCASGCEYASINAAINAASNGDVIQLAAETYFEGEQIDTFGKAITLRGVLDKAGEPASVLDGAGKHRVLVCQSGEGTGTVFERLVIRNGYSFAFGAGMYNESSSPTLSDCAFKGNSAYSGGGMFNFFSSPTLTDCVFASNLAEYNGGGMFNLESSSSLIHCTFSGNAAGNLGGGMFNDGSSPNLTGCTVCDNGPDQIAGSWNDARGNCVSISCDDCDLPSDPCPTDLDQNGITDGSDLGAFFVYWGECQVDDCPADFNDDEVVDGIDLGILFSAWGPCQ